MRVRTCTQTHIYTRHTFVNKVNDFTLLQHKCGGVEKYACARKHVADVLLRRAFDESLRALAA